MSLKPLPCRCNNNMFVCVQEEDREEAKEWVLAVSMDQRVQQVLNTDERGCYEGSLLNVHNNVTSPQCILTG